MSRIFKVWLTLISDSFVALSDGIMSIPKALSLPWSGKNNDALKGSSTGWKGLELLAIESSAMSTDSGVGFVTSCDLISS